MLRRLTLTLIALLVLSSFTAASAMAGIGSAAADAASSVQQPFHCPTHCPDCGKGHDCTSACPLMCGAVAPRSNKLGASQRMRSPDVPLATRALSSVGNRPDLPPPRTGRPLRRSIQLGNLK